MKVKYFKISVLIDGYKYTDTLTTYSKREAVEIVKYTNPNAKVVRIVEL